eukprot:s295_g12.t1
MAVLVLESHRVSGDEDELGNYQVFEALQDADPPRKAMKEILLAGDTNRLVAELTFVRINDLAAPPESINPLMYIEPFVSFLIIANGIMIGFQTDRRSMIPCAANLTLQKFGFLFVFCYVVTYMLVALGIFNVILAVYVDITMRAAKETEAVTSEQHARESIRIARTTRRVPSLSIGDTRARCELLKKFAQASLSKCAEAFSKELFLLVIQDRNVQALMDDLDLPPDRANLFEVIDADGSGTMDVTELVQGMLKIRGDVKKSDTVATLLATKALQEMVSESRHAIRSIFLQPTRRSSAVDVTVHVVLDAAWQGFRHTLLEAHADTAADDPTLSAHLELLQRIKAESPGWKFGGNGLQENES